MKSFFEIQYIGGISLICLILTNIINDVVIITEDLNIDN